MQTQAQVEKEDKWETIKILKVLKEEIEEYNEKTGKFSNVPDFVTYASRRLLEEQQRSRK